MRYFYDTEFIEDGTTIDLLSIGVVAEDGREFYACSTEADTRKAGPWVVRNVLPLLPNPSSPAWKSRTDIRDGLVEFFGDDHHISLWAWVGPYDHVALAQLFGDMPALPRQIPRYTRDIKHFWELLGRPALPPIPETNHSALTDARHNAEKFAVIAAECRSRWGLELD